MSNSNSVEMRKRNTGPLGLYNAYSQNIAMSFVVFTGPGLFNALQGLGNAGGSDPQVSGAMNAVLYLVMFLITPFGGFLFNLMGPRLMLALAPLGYVVYDLGVYFWGKNSDLAWFAILGAAILGVLASFLWTAAPAIALAYPVENRKGHYFSIFWAIFNFGSVIGGLIAFAVNFNISGSPDVGAGTYFTFVALGGFGCVLGAVLITNPKNVVRSDGSMVEFKVADDWKQEIKHTFAMFANPTMLLFAPIAFFSNFMYPYHTGSVSGLLFNARTRGVGTAIFFGVSQMFGSYVLGTFILDSKKMRRTQRGWLGYAITIIACIGLWVFAGYELFAWKGGYNYQTDTPVGHFDKDNQLCALTGPPLANQSMDYACTAANACFNGTFYEPPACPQIEGGLQGAGQLIDITESSRVALPMVLYFCMGMVDAFVQTYANWFFGTLSNNAADMARYGGFYKSMQSLGGFVSWAMDAFGVSYTDQFYVNCALLVVSIVTTFILTKSITDETEHHEVDVYDTDDEETRVAKKSEYV